MRNTAGQEGIYLPDKQIFQINKLMYATPRKKPVHCKIKIK